MYHRDRDDEITAYADAERLKTRMVKKKFAKKRKGTPPPSYQRRAIPEEQGRKSFLWSRTEKRH